MTLNARILTVSDSVARGLAEDRSGTALATRLIAAGFGVDQQRLVEDGVAPVAEALRGLAAGFTGVIVTTGGTGFGPRDLTPEATRSVMEREAPGIAEAMRLVNPLGRLSRGVAGTVGTALILNVPGSPTGAVECVDAVLDILPHVLSLLAGENPHPHHSHGSSGQPPETGGSTATSSP